MSAFRTVVATALVGGLCAFALGRACVRSARIRPLGPHGAGTLLLGRHASYTVHTANARVTVRALDGTFTRDVDLSVVVDGHADHLTLGREGLRLHKDELAIPFHVDVGDQRADTTLSFRVDVASDALVVALLPSGSVPMPGHTFALRAELATEGRTAFVSGVGELADLGVVSGGIVAVDADPRPLGFVSARGPLEVEAGFDEGSDRRATPMRIAITSPRQEIDVNEPRPTDLRLALGVSSTRLWGSLHHLAGDVTARVKGVVTGARVRARVYGLDAEGAPQVSALASPDGRFVLDVPKTVVEWYAAVDATHTSAPVTFVPGTPWDLRLDVSPGGELRIRILDADSGQPLTARLLVHGIDGTLDPSFGPDYRASGAGPIIDALRGEVTTPVPVGRYRIAATKGLEWSVDAKVVDVATGQTAALDLAPRHVVPTPGVVGCDLHVHARPSFDTPVQPEDRVLSLVAAGVDFAVPSEHNIVGDYGPMLDTLDLAHDLAYVTGVEVTTFSPRFGHFGVYPFPVGQRVPPFRATSPTAIFNSVRRGDPTRILQVNHPRLPMAIGYFEIFKYDPATMASPPHGMRLDFDSLEVYNGYEMAHPERVERVMHDYYALLDRGHRYVATGSSDSHRIQYQWAGYPRTMVAVGDPAAAGDTGAAVDTQAVIAALKKGHATITTGPVLEVELAGAHPGDEVVTVDDPLSLHVRVRAAPWVDVTTVEVVVGGRAVETRSVASQPTKLGSEAGTLPEAQARSLRFDEDIKLAIGPANTWIIVVVRGSRRLDDVLPFMPIQPMAMSNPIWVTRDKSQLPVPETR